MRKEPKRNKVTPTKLIKIIEAVRVTIVVTVLIGAGRLGMGRGVGVGGGGMMH